MRVQIVAESVDTGEQALQSLFGHDVADVKLAMFVTVAATQIAELGNLQDENGLLHFTALGMCLFSNLVPGSGNQEGTIEGVGGSQKRQELLQRTVGAAVLDIAVGIECDIERTGCAVVVRVRDRCGLYDQRPGYRKPGRRIDFRCIRDGWRRANAV